MASKKLAKILVMLKIWWGLFWAQTKHASNTVLLAGFVPNFCFGVARVLLTFTMIDMKKKLTNTGTYTWPIHAVLHKSVGSI
jgi:hypothetical protein